jgi:hypothetical protein
MSVLPEFEAHREYFFLTAMAIQVRYDMLDGAMSHQELYDSARASGVPFHEWYPWIRRKLEGGTSASRRRRRASTLTKSEAGGGAAAGDETREDGSTAARDEKSAGKKGNTGGGGNSGDAAASSKSDTADDAKPVKRGLFGWGRKSASATPKKK